ncbi:beta-lactamase-like protein [Aspergillus foveolatus]|uniref:beta-lactamase-like protein n=1 Tax=Aspergillus foveolatus TaxID=210207 RepID=UPI003CCD9ED2
MPTSQNTSTKLAALSSDASINSLFQEKCIIEQAYPPMFEVVPVFVNPFSPFDNLFFVGHTVASAWAYNITEGIVLIDSLDNPEEVEAFLIPSLESVGLSGEGIKYLIITHEHGGHYGGPKYIQDKFYPKVYASEKAWEGMEAMGPDADPPVPARDQVLSDSQVLTVGGVTFHIVLTPGHTPGTLSLIFPVFDQGEPHLAGLSGGSGDPKKKYWIGPKIISQYRFGRSVDYALWKADLLAHRVSGELNPFAIGSENYEKYMQTQAICSWVIAARKGMELPV